LSFLLTFAFITAFAQIPAGYYDGTTGLSGAALKTKLKEIISNGHQDHGYGGLWTGYQTTDRDYSYENDGTILDIYSENP
ncbi:endonuclease, partial [Burkholderia sp. SIMBA_042]